MTTDHTTEPSAVSRRTILRTTANAAWMVPAISLASAVPAMAACSLTTDFTLIAGAATNHPASGGKASRTQSYTVTNATDGVGGSGAGGTATLLVRVDEVAHILIDLLGLTDSTAGWSIAVGGGWAAGPTSGTPGDTGSTYVFTKFIGCGQTATADVTFSWTSGLGLTTPPQVSATVSP